MGASINSKFSEELDLVLFKVGIVCSGCRNETPWFGWLKQQKVVLLQFWGLEVQEQVLFWGLLAWRADGHPLSVSSPGLSSVQESLMSPWCPNFYLWRHQSGWINTPPLPPSPQMASISKYSVVCVYVRTSAYEFGGNIIHLIKTFFGEFPLRLRGYKPNSYPQGCRFDPWPRSVG